MDPAECLDILCKSVAAHTADKEKGIAGGCCSACPGGDGGDALVNAILGQGLGAEAAEISEGYVTSQGGDDGPPAPPPPPLPPRGQVIDLESGENELSAASIAERFPALLEKQGAETEKQQGEKAADLGDNADDRAVAQQTEELQGMSPAALAKEVVALHEQRVTVHKAYQGAFQHLLSAPGGGAEAIARTYPFVVGCATARFAALSRRVRAAAGLLEAKAAADGAAAAESVKEAASLIRKLQRLEQERLQLLAATHLEETRLWAAGRVKAKDQASQTLRLARKTCADIKRQLGVTSEGIEETVSELRYCAADLQGDN